MNTSVLEHPSINIDLTEIINYDNAKNKANNKKEQSVNKLKPVDIGENNIDKYFLDTDLNYKSMHSPLRYQNFEDT